MRGRHASKRTARPAMSRSRQATCGKSGHTSPTAITIATKITARVRSWSSKAGPEHREPALPSVGPRQRAGRKLARDLLNDQPIRPPRQVFAVAEKDIAMRAYNTNRDTFDRSASAFVGTDPGTVHQRPPISSTRPGLHRRLVRR